MTKTYRVSFTLVLGDDVGAKAPSSTNEVQELMDHEGIETITNGLRQRVFGRALHDLHSISVSEEP